MQHEVSHEAGHLAQEAGQAALVDVEGQAVAEAQESHHAAPVNATLEQAAGRGVMLSAETPRRPPWPAHPLPQSGGHPPCSQLESKTAEP